MARAGAVVNLEGFFSASPQPRIFAMGFRLWALSADSETRTRAAAPSDRGEAFAAVTVPLVGLKLGRRVRVFDSLNCGKYVSAEEQTERQVNLRF